MLNVYRFADALFKYDQMSKLDRWKTKVSFT